MSCVSLWTGGLSGCAYALGTGPRYKPCKRSLRAQGVMLMRLLLSLSRREMLPAIIFNYDRAGCEQYALLIVRWLEDAQRAARRRYAQQLDDAIQKSQVSQAPVAAR